jgi:exodeoxyribonuclease VII large subunit
MHKSEVSKIAGRLSALNPLAVLDRGYSVTYDETGSILTCTKDIKKGQTIKTRLSKGEFLSEVKDVR